MKTVMAIDRKGVLDVSHVKDVLPAGAHRRYASTLDQPVDRPHADAKVFSKLIGVHPFSVPTRVPSRLHRSGLQSEDPRCIGMRRMKLLTGSRAACGRTATVPGAALVSRLFQEGMARSRSGTVAG